MGDTPLDSIYIVGMAAALVVGWFALGMIYNLRRGDAMLKWLRGGLSKVGERTTFRWLGSSVAEMVINQAKRPFRQLTILLVLTPRDVPFLWAWALLRGRRDTLIFRGQLGAAPKVDLELGDPRSYTGRMALHDVARRGWESQPFGDLRLMAPTGYMDLARSTVESLAEPKTALSLAYSRFALRRVPPHFEVHMPFPDPHQRDADEYFESLRTLARAVSQSD